jgi:hypothetical protein
MYLFNLLSFTEMAIELKELIAYIRDNRFIGLSVYLVDNGFEVVGCEVSQHKGNLEVVTSFRFADDISLLSNFVSGQYPVVVQLDGKGIMHKGTNGNSSMGENIVNALFPGIDHDDFIVQQWCREETARFVSIGRKDQVDSLLDGLNGLGYHVVSFIMGPFVIEPFLGIIGNHKNIIYHENTSITVHENAITTIRREKSDGLITYYLQEDCFEGDVLLAFCAILGHKSGSFIDALHVNVPLVAQMQEQNRYKRNFLRLSLGGGVGVLLILLINFLLYSKFSTEINGATQLYNSDKELLEKLSLLESELHEKSRFVGENNLMSNSHKAWYCDKIASLVGTDVDLARLEIEPIVGRIKSEKPIKYDKNVVRIVGNAGSERDLSMFIRELRPEKWVKDVVIESFKDDDRHSFTFVLRIELNPN